MHMNTSAVALSVVPLGPGSGRSAAHSYTCRCNASRFKHIPVRRPRSLAAAAHPSPPLFSVTRRAIGGFAAAIGSMTVTAGAQAALGGLFGGGQRSARSLVASGSDKFLQGDVKGSMEDFDAASAADEALRPFLWQRGISAYYAGEFAAGAAQFRADVAVNPNDTEEAIWAFLCEAQISGAADARANFLEVGRDPRPILRAAYECFKTGDPPQRILDAAGMDDSGHDRFYALLYEGLWHESEGDAAGAEAALVAATNTEYGCLSPDYMTAVAKVHCRQRGWSSAA